MSDTHFISLKASDKGGSRGAGRISAVPRNTCQHLSQDGLHIHAPGSQELHGGMYKIKLVKSQSNYWRYCRTSYLVLMKNVFVNTCWTRSLHLIFKCVCQKKKTI